MLRKHSRFSIAFVWEGGRVEKRQRRLGIIAYGIPLRPKELSMIPTWAIRLYGRIRWWPLHGTSVSIYPTFLRPYLQSFVRNKTRKELTDISIKRLANTSPKECEKGRERRPDALRRCCQRIPGIKKLIHIWYLTAKHIAKSCELHSAKLPTHITHTLLSSVYASTSKEIIEELITGVHYHWSYINHSLLIVSKVVWCNIITQPSNWFH